MFTNDDFNVGDAVAYQPFGGGLRWVEVRAKEDDIKNGRAGFDGIIVDTNKGVWGYTDQIVKVVKLIKN